MGRFRDSSEDGAVDSASVASFASSTVAFVRRIGQSRLRASTSGASRRRPRSQFAHSLPGAYCSSWRMGGRTTDGDSRKGAHVLSAALRAVAFALTAFVGFDVFKFVRSLDGEAIRKWRDLGVSEDGRGELGATATDATVIYDVKRRVVARFASRLVPLDHVAKSVWQAIVSAEDRRFFTHHGFDVRGLGRAVLSLGLGGGGSTITQQLVKNTLLTDERSISRKLAEILMAVLLEARISKREILERYLYNCYWGHGCYGIKDAAALYFGKKPMDLSISEGAMLAALLPSPEALSPFHDRDAAERRHAIVLHQMSDCGYIDKGTALELIRQGLPRSLSRHYSAKAHTNYSLGQNEFTDADGGVPYSAPDFVDEVLRQLRDLEGDAFSHWTAAGGLQIFTTLDLDLQELAENTLKRSIKGTNEASFVVMDAATSAIRSMIGGVKYDANNRSIGMRAPTGALLPPAKIMQPTPLDVLDSLWIALQQLRGACTRLPGSIFAPIIHAAALEAAMAGRPPPISGSNNLQVGGATEAAALESVPAVCQMANRLGVKREPSERTSPGLKFAEVSPLEITTVYNTICAGGVYSRPYLIRGVSDSGGRVLYRHHVYRKQVLAPQVNAVIQGSLANAMAYSISPKSRNGSDPPCGGISCVTKDQRHAWCVGYMGNITAGLWAGSNENGLQTPQENEHQSNGAPVDVAKPWLNFMERAMKLSSQ